MQGARHGLQTPACAYAGLFAPDYPEEFTGLAGESGASGPRSTCRYSARALQPSPETGVTGGSDPARRGVRLSRNGTGSKQYQRTETESLRAS